MIIVDEIDADLLDGAKVYRTHQEAARAYDVAAVIHFGECAKLNFGASP